MLAFVMHSLPLEQGVPSQMTPPSLALSVPLPPPTPSPPFTHTTRQLSSQAV